MNKAAIYLLLMMGIGILFPSCEQALVDEFPIMETYYVESKTLPSVTIDSVKHFITKFDGFIEANPRAKQHNKYQPIVDNIKGASLRIVITVDTAWLGDTTIYFARPMYN